METHLLDIVSRGKPSQAVAGLRPLHGFTYRFRNARRSRAYGADEQLYEMLSHASGDVGHVALRMLKDFFFAGVDARTEAPRLGDDIDVETQALISLSEAVRGEIADRAAGAAQAVLPAALPAGGGPARRRRAAAARPPRVHPAHCARRVPQDPLRLPPGPVPPEDHEAAARHGPGRQERERQTAGSSSTSPACRTPRPHGSPSGALPRGSAASPPSSAPRSR